MRCFEDYGFTPLDGLIETNSLKYSWIFVLVNSSIEDSFHDPMGKKTIMYCLAEPWVRPMHIAAFVFTDAVIGHEVIFGGLSSPVFGPGTCAAIVVVPKSLAEGPAISPVPSATSTGVPLVAASAPILPSLH